MHTHIDCAAVIGQGVLREDEDAVSVVRLGEPRQTLGAFPQATDLDAAAGWYGGPRSLHHVWYSTSLTSLTQT